jgi:hypothetical protein
VRPPATPVQCTTFLTWLKTADEDDSDGSDEE